MVVEEASKVTLERGAKKVQAYHLYVALVLFASPPSRGRVSSRKHAVETTEMLGWNLCWIHRRVGLLTSMHKWSKMKKNGTAPAAKEQKK